MKAELKDLRLGISPVSKEIYIGTLVPDKTRWKNKVNATSDFLACCLTKFKDKPTIIVSGNEKFEITCKKIE